MRSLKAFLTTALLLVLPACGSSGTVDRTSAVVGVSGEVLTPYDDAVADPAVGRPAPAINGTDHNGASVTFLPGTDGPTLLAFVAHWCPHCQKELPELVRWREGGANGVNVIVVSSAENPSQPNWPASAWFDAEGWKGHVIVDDASGTALSAFGIKGFPAFVAVAADGTVAARRVGVLSPADLDALTNDLGQK